MNESVDVKRLEPHPISEIFPLLTGQEFAELVESMRLAGFDPEQPIFLYDGKILDGRNRYRAALEARVEPVIKTWTGDDPLAFVLRMNLVRRHLDLDDRIRLSECVDQLRKREAGKVQEEGQRKGRNSRNANPGLRSQEREPKKKRGRESADDTARDAGVSAATVKRRRLMQVDHPGIYKRFQNRELTWKEAQKAVRKERHRLAQESAHKAAIEIGTPRWVLTESQVVVPCQAVITDPPYGILDEPWEPEKLEQFTREWLGQWNKCGADVFLSFWSQEHLWAGKTWFEEGLTNYEFRQLLVWRFANNNKHHDRAFFKRSWEPIFYFVRKGATVHPSPGSSEWGEDSHNFDSHDSAIPQSNFNGSEYKEHPAQKPLSVMRWLIGATTKTGDLVCDPFAGSGTTGIAALQLGRLFHGIETDDDFRKLARGRIAAYGGEFEESQRDALKRAA